MNSIPSVPNGAIENGRVFLQRLAEHYDFSCEAGSLANCTDYQEAVRCFEFIAEWFSGFPYAIPHLSAPCAVEVKKLDWNIPFPHETQERAESVFGTYAIWEIGGEGYYRTPNATAGTPVHGNKEAAKAAAQADFERRILSCVVTKPVEANDDVLPCDVQLPGVLFNRGVSISALLKAIERRKAWPEADTHLKAKPVDVAAVRRQALEEAAKVAEATWPNGGPMDIGHGSRIATAIRALSAEPVQGDNPKGQQHDK